MYTLKDFFENGLFVILGAIYDVLFVVRSVLNMHEHGSYNDIMEWIRTSGYGRHEVVSAKLDFIMDVIEIQIR